MKPLAKFKTWRSSAALAMSLMAPAMVMTVQAILMPWSADLAIELALEVNF